MAVMVRAMFLEPYLSYILVKTKKERNAFSSHAHVKLFSNRKLAADFEYFLHIIRVHSTLTDLKIVSTLLSGMLMSPAQGRRAVHGSPNMYG